MTATELRQRITNRLLDEIDEVQYPSAGMLDRAEKTLGNKAALATYVETLVERIEAERFPSPSVLNRIDGLLAKLEQMEQQEKQRELSAA